MEALIRPLLIAMLMAFSNTSEAPENPLSNAVLPENRPYRWTKVIEEGPWKKSYNFQFFNHRDTLWVFHPDGNWFSADGRIWQKSALPNAIYNLAFLDYVQFNNSILGLGH